MTYHHAQFGCISVSYARIVPLFRFTLVVRRVNLLHVVASQVELDVSFICR